MTDPVPSAAIDLILAKRDGRALTGDTMPATPKPVFIMPPAVPAYLPAISSGSVQSTGLVISRKKNDPSRPSTNSTVPAPV